MYLRDFKDRNPSSLEAFKSTDEERGCLGPTLMQVSLLPDDT
jgi:hypothetical protein